MSPGLYYQQVGRGFRLHPDKHDCLILDFAGNIMCHGPVDAVRIREPRSNGNGEAPAKECPNCHAVVATGYVVCPECGYEFPPPERTPHEAKASTESILSGETTIIEHEVQGVVYSVHVKRDATPEHPKTMRVEYVLGLQQYVSEWICIEHTGWPRQKAESWWRERSDEPCPATAEEAVEVAKSGGLCETLVIKVKHTEGERYDRVVGYTLGQKPRMPGWDEDTSGELEPVAAWYDNEEVPF